MKNKFYCATSAVVSLVLIMVSGVAGCSAKKQASPISGQPYEQKQQDQFNNIAVNTLQKLITMNMNVRKGSTDSAKDEFDAKVYGEYVPLLKIEQGYYQELNNLLDSFMDEKDKLDQERNEIDSFEKSDKVEIDAKKLADHADALVSSVKSLNEKNLKDINSLTIQDGFVNHYLMSKTEMNELNIEYTGQIKDYIEQRSSYMIDILEAIKKESLAANQAEKDKYHKLQEDLLGKIKELVSRWKNIENEMNAGMDKLCKSAVEWQ